MARASPSEFLTKPDHALITGAYKYSFGCKLRSQHRGMNSLGSDARFILTDQYHPFCTFNGFRMGCNLRKISGTGLGCLVPRPVNCRQIFNCETYTLKFTSRGHRVRTHAPRNYPRPVVIPPSTRRLTPVMYAACWEHRKVTAAAIS